MMNVGSRSRCVRWDLRKGISATLRRARNAHRCKKMHIPIDHLVYATPDLPRGVREIEELTGITPTPGGQHPGRGTRNALVDLGDGAYLEIIAPDPDQPAPPTPRWFGVDAVTTSRLTAWSVKSAELPDLRRRAIDNAIPLGQLRSGARQRADGATLAWKITDPVPLVEDGAIPFFIDWTGSPHPSESAARGATLVELRLEHPNPDEIRRMLRALDLDIGVSAAEQAAIVATIEGPRGRFELR